MALSATFDPALSTTKDRVRLRLGDVSSVPQWFLQDATIVAMLGMYSYDEACAQLAETIANICAQEAMMTAQRNLKIQYADRQTHFMALAKSIRDNMQPGPGDPVNTGASIGQMTNPNCTDYLFDTPDGCSPLNFAGPPGSPVPWNS